MPPAGFRHGFLSEEDRARPGHALRLSAPRSARRLIITDQDRRGLLLAVPKLLIYREAASLAARFFAACRFSKASRSSM